MSCSAPYERFSFLFLVISQLRKQLIFNSIQIHTPLFQYNWLHKNSQIVLPKPAWCLWQEDWTKTGGNNIISVIIQNAHRIGSDAGQLPVLKICFQITTRIPRMELMPTASRYLLELKSFNKLSLKFYISRYLFFKKLKRLQILCDFQKYL